MGERVVGVVKQGSVTTALRFCNSVMGAHVVFVAPSFLDEDVLDCPIAQQGLASCNELLFAFLKRDSLSLRIASRGIQRQWMIAVGSFELKRQQ